MNFADLLRLLPNGLHDAYVHEVRLDYPNALAELSVDVWVGELYAPPGPFREAMRMASITFTGLHYFVVEPPRTVPDHSLSPLWIDAGLISELQKRPEVSLPDAPAGTSECWLFVRDWNAFIYLAADDVRLEWR